MPEVNCLGIRHKTTMAKVMTQEFLKLIIKQYLLLLEK